MRNGTLLVYILLLISGICCGQTINRTTQIDALLDTRTSNPFNGVVLISQNGKTVYSKICGYSDFERKAPLKFDDRFVIGSISKQITAVIVLQEYEKEHLKLDEPIRTYLPEFPQSWADTVTIRHLLTHMHGIADPDKPTAFPVGTRFDYGYSSLGYDLLAKIVERTSGKSFVELSMHLFAKCKMKNTFHPKAKKYISLVKGYTMQEDGELKFDTTSFRNPVAAGAFISTAADLASWNENFFGGKLLKKETFDLLTAKQPGAVRNHPVFGTTEYGLGITVDDREGIIQWGQTGYADGFVSMDFYFPQTKTSVIVLENVVSDEYDTKKAFSYHVKILNIVQKSLSLEVRYLKEGKLIMETIPLDFIDMDGRLKSPYIDTIRFCRLDSMTYTDNHPDRDVQYTTPVALNFLKQIQPQSPEYYSAFTIHYTSKAMEYYNQLFESKIDFDYKPEYRTIEVCFGDFPGNTTPDFYIYAEHSTPSPSICFHEVGHRAFWYIQDTEKGLGIRFKGLSVVHMGLLEYFTVSLNDSPVVGEDCLPVKMIRDASRIYNYPLNDSLNIRHTLELMGASYPAEMKNPQSNIAKYLSASYATYSDEILDKVYDNHRGGMALTSTLWRIRQSIGQEKTDRLVVQTILNLNRYMDKRADFYSKEKIDSLPNKIDWCDVFYGLVQQDRELFEGKHVPVITKEFEKTGYPVGLVNYQ